MYLLTRGSFRYSLFVRLSLFSLIGEPNRGWQDVALSVGVILEVGRSREAALFELSIQREGGEREEEGAGVVFFGGVCTKALPRRDFEMARRRKRDDMRKRGAWNGAPSSLRMHPRSKKGLTD